MLAWSLIVSMATLHDRYCARLGLEITEPTVESLKKITQAHLEKIPFENLGQHGAHGGSPVLDIAESADKVLVRNRGGFCFELNGLLAAWWEELGGSVLRLPAVVYKGHFDSPASHVILLIDCQGKRYYVDVGFGEPPLHPLPLVLDEVLETPEGMRSRFERHGDRMVLLWELENEWVPRLSWDFEASQGNRGWDLVDFSGPLSVVLDDGSIFARKMVITRCTANEKYTLAGNRLKVTGPCRFGNQVQKTVRELSSIDEVRSELNDRFGISKAETEHLDLSRSLEGVNCDVWSQF